MKPFQPALLAVFAAAAWTAPAVIPPRSVAERGDVVLRHGTGFWSEKFLQTSPRDVRFSHAGIVVSADGREPVVVHAVAGEFSGAGFVREDGWREFFGGSPDAAVFRLAAEADVRGAVADRAKNLVGRPFDASFDLETTNEVYCTELVRLAVNGATGEETVGTARLGPLEFVPVDACYLGDGFECVWDATNATPRPRKDPS